MQLCLASKLLKFWTKWETFCSSKRSVIKYRGCNFNQAQKRKEAPNLRCASEHQGKCQEEENVEDLNSKDNSVFVTNFWTFSWFWWIVMNIFLLDFDRFWTFSCFACPLMAFGECNSFVNAYFWMMMNYDKLVIFSLCAFLYLVSGDFGI